MSPVAEFQAVAISLGLGLLVGLQRQWKESEIAGIRTFPLISLLGTLSVLSQQGTVGWLSGSGLIGIAIILAVANVAKISCGDFDYGMTTEVAAFLMYAVGCALGAGITRPAIVTAGVAAVLLHWKAPLHGLVHSLKAKDLRAVMQLALIGLIILPVLPDQTYGPYDVLNPYSIWRMVVLIVGISLSAYVAYKLLGARVGSVLGGIFGGLISSTATTVSYARQSKGAAELSAVAALVILIASTMVNIRVLFEIGVVAPRLLNYAAVPLGIMLLLMTVECVFLFLPLRKQSADLPDHENPAQLKPALIFAALYAFILFLTAAAKDVFGDQALYWIAIVSGLTDVDAITLSTAHMFNDQRVGAGTAWRVILLATLSNLVFKAGAVAMLGSRKLLVYLVITFGIALAGGVALLFLWPTTDISTWYSS